MGYLDKMHKKIQMQKLIEQAMNTEQYKAARKKDMEESALNAYMSFCIIACDYLELNYRCKKKGLMKFLAFASKRLKYVEENENYFIEMNEMFREEMDLDVLEILGMKIERGEANG